jgi:hypothetical protein
MPDNNPSAWVIQQQSGPIKTLDFPSAWVYHVTMAKKISTAAQALGALGGSKTSDAKKRTARENGKLGGRPKKPKPDPKR